MIEILALLQNIAPLLEPVTFRQMSRMLGKRNPQASLFDAIGLPHRVAPDSFYGRMGQMIGTLFRDEDLKEMYCEDNGRPSLPPSLLAGVLLLQFYDDVSDREAAERVIYDLRWKVALNLTLDYQGFDYSNLSKFRGRLVENHQERYAFDRLLAHARQEGVLVDIVTILSDTTNAKGAGATQDTYTLLRKGIRKLIKTMGYHLPGKRAGSSAQIEKLLKTYVNQDRKAEIDWGNVLVRNAQLTTLVEDSQAVLELALEQIDDPEVRSLGWMISKIIGDDVEQTPEGGRKIRKGTAADRFISLYDTEMRHGRKSASKKFDEHKVSTMMDQASELILDIEDLAAPLGDGQDLLPAIERIEEHVGVTINAPLWTALMALEKIARPVPNVPTRSICLRRWLVPATPKCIAPPSRSILTPKPPPAPMGKPLQIRASPSTQKSGSRSPSPLSVVFARLASSLTAVYAVKQRDAPFI